MSNGVTPGPAGGGASRSIREVLATPVGELVSAGRGARRDAEAIIAGEGAGLAAGVREHIREVVRRTRLRRGEKADVARELVSHFREAVEAGAAPERVLMEFGSAKATARLIRRAKLRCRGWLWHAKVRALQGLGVTVGLAACVYAYGAARFHLGEAVISRNYVAEWNAAALATPMEERAWPRYAEALEALWSGNDMWTRLWPDEAGELKLDWREQEPGTAGWAEVRAWLGSHGEAMEKLRRAAMLPRLGYVISGSWDDDLERVLRARNPGAVSGRPEETEANPALMVVLLPQLGELRNVGRVLRLDAVRAAEEGDAATVHADLMALFRVCEHAAETPCLIGELSSVAHATAACDAVLGVLGDHPGLFSGEQLALLAHGVAAMRSGSMQASFEGERAIFDDMLQRCFSDDGNGDGVLVSAVTGFLTPSLDLSEASHGDRESVSFTGPVMTLAMAGRRAQREHYERVVNFARAQAALPAWKRDWGAMRAAEERETGGALVRARYWPAHLLLPAFSRVIAAGDKAAMVRDGALVAIALHAYAGERGGFPGSLEELVPKYLAAVPVDRHDGLAMRYVVREGRPVVYSVGANGRDEGGVQSHGRAGNTVAAGFGQAGAETREGRSGVSVDASGDWVIFPAVRDDN